MIFKWINLILYKVVVIYYYKKDWNNNNYNNNFKQFKIYKRNNNKLMIFINHKINKMIL